MNKSLNTTEGQFAAGKFVAKNYWNVAVENRSARLETRALIHRLYNDDYSPRADAERKILLDAWERGIMEGRRVRLELGL